MLVAARSCSVLGGVVLGGRGCRRRGRRSRRSPSTSRFALVHRLGYSIGYLAGGPSSDRYAMSGVGCSGGAEIVCLVVSIVPARAYVHLRGRGIDAMWRRNSTRPTGQHIVCFVVFIVVALGGVWVFGTEVASGMVLFHVCLRRWALDWLASGRRRSLSARLKTGAMVAVGVNGFVNETRRNCRDGVARGAVVRTGD